MITKNELTAEMRKKNALWIVAFLTPAAAMFSMVATVSLALNYDPTFFYSATNMISWMVFTVVAIVPVCYITNRLATSLRIEAEAIRVKIDEMDS